MLMIVDLQSPKSPKELGRWWLPGTKVGDDAPAPARVKPFDSGFRMLIPRLFHLSVRIALIWDGSMLEIIVLDIADKTKPKEVSRISWQSLNEGFMHTVVPILDRGLLVASKKSTKENCMDWPMRITIVDIQKETRPYPLAVLPPPTNFFHLCRGGGRFGAHNINLNHMPEISRVLKNTVVTAQFAGGLQIYSIQDPREPKELPILRLTFQATRVAQFK